MLGTILLTLLIIFIVALILNQPKEEYHSHWAQMLVNFKFSTKEFYSLVKQEMSNNEIEGLKFTEVSLNIGSIISSKRLYMRIQWQDYHYDLCFAPFGDGCFVSWWLIFEASYAEEFFSKVPLIGKWIVQSFYRKTYYQIDTASMFMTYAQKSVLSVIDEITKETGFRLSEDQRKPILNDIFKR